MQRKFQFRKSAGHYFHPEVIHESFYKKQKLIFKKIIYHTILMALALETSIFILCIYINAYLYIFHDIYQEITYFWDHMS